ncbi:unnamed protein product [Adineta steineri]|uniref:G-protein coupled receptors family 1 profile domain-containing protein n=1 Tax=Adineta steineri TaxID=433720 RepID=A0A814BS40_9BILA|nr:unnamed protein product [Adineta steineri]CAF0864605.1 unnamed protein product [Adineta steineri]CAF0930449.1 unnamed protein product [Adineta steineri]
MNLTLSPLEASFKISDYYAVCLLSGIISIIAIVISIFILILVWRTKPQLHTVRHLLMCNTSIASILYCIIQSINYIFLIFLPSEKTDLGCRWRGYFAYLSICGISYSYFIQAISRFFISILSHKYRWLTTFKAHYILILIQWFTVIIIPLPAIITKDIHYRPTSLCWVPLKYIIHVIYTFFAYYIFPALCICIIYIYIYHRVKRITNHPDTLFRFPNGEKRDLELLRNIMILLGIYWLGGIPSILFVITANKSIYLISIISISLTVAVEKICTSILDRDIRQHLKRLLISRNRVVSFDHGRDIQNPNHIQVNPYQNVVKI